MTEICDKKVRFIEICYYSRGICLSFSTTVVTVLHLTFGLLIEGTAVWAILRFAPEPVRLLLGASAVGHLCVDFASNFRLLLRICII